MLTRVSAGLADRQDQEDDRVGVGAAVGFECSGSNGDDQAGAVRVRD